MDNTNASPPTCPHHKLIAYQLALQFARLIGSLAIRDTRMREHARKSAGSCALNSAEGAARFSQADKSRVFTLARAEVCEAVAAVEVAEALGACSAENLAAAQALGKRVSDVLSRLIH